MTGTEEFTQTRKIWKSKTWTEHNKTWNLKLFKILSLKIVRKCAFEDNFQASDLLNLKTQLEPTPVTFHKPVEPEPERVFKRCKSITPKPEVKVQIQRTLKLNHQYQNVGLYWESAFLVFSIMIWSRSMYKKSRIVELHSKSWDE